MNTIASHTARTLVAAGALATAMLSATVAGQGVAAASARPTVASHNHPVTIVVPTLRMRGTGPRGYKLP